MIIDLTVVSLRRSNPLLILSHFLAFFLRQIDTWFLLVNWISTEKGKKTEKEKEKQKVEKENKGKHNKGEKIN